MPPSLESEALNRLRAPRSKEDFKTLVKEDDSSDEESDQKDGEFPGAFPGISPIGLGDTSYY